MAEDDKLGDELPGAKYFSRATDDPKFNKLNTRDKLKWATKNLPNRLIAGLLISKILVKFVKIPIKYAIKLSSKILKNKLIKDNNLVVSNTNKKSFRESVRDTLSSLKKFPSNTIKRMKNLKGSDKIIANKIKADFKKRYNTYRVKRTINKKKHELNRQYKQLKSDSKKYDKNLGMTGNAITNSVKRRSYFSATKIFLGKLWTNLNKSTEKDRKLVHRGLKKNFFVGLKLLSRKLQGYNDTINSLRARVRRQWNSAETGGLFTDFIGYKSNKRFTDLSKTNKEIEKAKSDDVKINIILKKIYQMQNDSRDVATNLGYELKKLTNKKDSIIDQKKELSNNIKSNRNKLNSINIKNIDLELIKLQNEYKSKQDKLTTVNKVNDKETYDKLYEEISILRTNITLLTRKRNEEVALKDQLEKSIAEDADQENSLNSELESLDNKIKQHEELSKINELRLKASIENLNFQREIARDHKSSEQYMNTIDMINTKFDLSYEYNKAILDNFGILGKKTSEDITKKNEALNNSFDELVMVSLKNAQLYQETNDLNQKGEFDRSTKIWESIRSMWKESVEITNEQTGVIINNNEENIKTNTESTKEFINNEKEKLNQVESQLMEQIRLGQDINLNSISETTDEISKNISEKSESDRAAYNEKMNKIIESQSDISKLSTEELIFKFTKGNMNMRSFMMKDFFNSIGDLSSGQTANVVMGVLNPIFVKLGLVFTLLYSLRDYIDIITGKVSYIDNLSNSVNSGAGMLTTIKSMIENLPVFKDILLVKLNTLQADIIEGIRSALPFTKGLQDDQEDAIDRAIDHLNVVKSHINSTNLSFQSSIRDFYNSEGLHLEKLANQVYSHSGLGDNEGKKIDRLRRLKEAMTLDNQDFINDARFIADLIEMFNTYGTGPEFGMHFNSYNVRVISNLRPNKPFIGWGSISADPLDQEEYSYFIMRSVQEALNNSIKLEYVDVGKHALAGAVSGAVIGGTAGAVVGAAGGTVALPGIGTVAGAAGVGLVGKVGGGIVGGSAGAVEALGNNAVRGIKNYNQRRSVEKQIGLKLNQKPIEFTNPDKPVKEIVDYQAELQGKTEERLDKVEDKLDELSEVAKDTRDMTVVNTAISSQAAIASNVAANTNGTQAPNVEQPDPTIDVSGVPTD